MLHEQGVAAMIQPYVETLHDPAFGERALVFFNGKFSYAISKGPVVSVGEDPFAFREDDQPNPRVCEPLDGDLLVAHKVLDNLPGDRNPFVARIDVVTHESASCLAEASIDDPLLFLDIAPSGAIEAYVDAAITRGAVGTGTTASQI